MMVVVQLAACLGPGQLLGGGEGGGTLFMWCSLKCSAERRQHSCLT